MSTDREVTRIVRSWLEEGVTALPDRVLDAVLDQVPATRQRRTWWPARRLPDMHISIRFATGAAVLAVLVVVAVVSFNLLPGTATIGGSPTPLAPSPTPGASLPVTSQGPVPIPAGRHTAADPFPLQVSFTVPAGWDGNIGGPNAVFLAQDQGPGGLAFSLNPQLYAEPCHTDQGFLSPPPGPSVDDLATALASLPGLTATTPTAVTLGGYQGKEVTLTAPASTSGCASGQYGVWQLPLGATNVLTAGQADRVWILDVAGQRLVIDALETPGQTAATTEVQGVLDSIQLAPGAPSSSALPSPTPSSSTGQATLNGTPTLLAPGRYEAADPFLLKVGFTVPAGWEGNIGGPYAVFLQQAQGPDDVSLSILDQVYADACHRDKGFLDPRPGPSVDDLATALASMPGLAATTPTAVTLDGLHGKEVTLTAPVSSNGCSGDYFGVWALPLGATNDLMPGQVDRVWILDVSGQRLVIDAIYTPGEAAATTAEVQGIVDSIGVGPGAAGPWPVTYSRAPYGPATNPLQGGSTYVAAEPFLLKVTFTAPAAWGGNIDGPYLVSLNQAQGAGAISFSIFENVVADPCHSDNGFLDPLPGPSVDDLATALARVPGLTVTKPTAVTLAGYQGKELTMTAPTSASGCTAGVDRVWELPLGATNDLTPGEVDKVWILDVGGERLVIDAPETPGETPASITEVQTILDSIGIAQLY